MAKFITLKRKYVWSGALIAFIVLASVVSANVLKSADVSTAGEEILPQIVITGIEFTPKIVIRDVEYEGEAYKGLQIVPATNYEISAVLRNQTTDTVKNVPIKLSICLAEDSGQIINKAGTIPSLEPGATAKISFENIDALGDSEGKKLAVGIHEMTISIEANPEGGITQNTQAKLTYVVDSKLK
ncbi:MAG: hypothetical protein WCR27_00935 [Eubacteriales bacterium]